MNSVQPQTSMHCSWVDWISLDLWFLYGFALVCHPMGAPLLIFVANMQCFVPGIIFITLWRRYLLLSLQPWQVSRSCEITQLHLVWVWGGVCEDGVGRRTKRSPDSTLFVFGVLFYFFRQQSWKSSPGRLLICCVDQVDLELKIMFLLPSGW